MNRHQREEIRLAVHSALREAFPELTSAPFDEWKMPGGLQLIHDHLDTLIDIVHAAPHSSVEEIRGAVQARICPGCRERFSSGYCVLRQMDGCKLDACLELVADTLKQQLQRTTD